MNMNEFPILLVEDHPDDAFLTLHALSKLDISNVMVKKNGVSAFNHLRQALEGDRTGSHLPRVLLVDINLPRLNGIDFIRILRRTEHLANLPVVVLTSSSRERDRNECLELGITAYLNKPLDHIAFAHVMKEAFGNRDEHCGHFDTTQYHAPLGSAMHLTESN